MGFDRLGVFGNFGMTAGTLGNNQSYSPALANPPINSRVFSQLLALTENADHPAVQLLGEWAPTCFDADLNPSYRVSHHSPKRLSFSSDSWAWAPCSFDSISVATLTATVSGVVPSTSQELPQASLSDYALITSAFLSELTDPRPLLRILKLSALNGGKSGIVHHSQWPSDAKFGDLKLWLERHGFRVQVRALSDGFLLLECSLTLTDYAAYLEEAGIDPAMLDVDKLLVTTEDADVQPTGGIGTYIKNVRSLNSRVGTLLCHLHANQSNMPRRTVCPKLFVGHASEESYFEGLGLIETVQALLCLLPGLASLEIQDYRSIGYRLVQGKCTGRLPTWLNLSVILHGSVDYVKFGVGDDTAVNYGAHDLKYAIKDAYIFENVDECLAPSRYLAQRLLSQEFGYTLNNPKFVRLPFDNSLIPIMDRKPFDKVTRLIYIGKYNRLKGWDDFVESVEALANRGLLSGISEIVSLAPTAPSREHRARIVRVAPYRSLHLSHAEILEFLTKHRHDSLVVIPSRGENYPFVVLEQLLVGTLFVAYNAGGAPEVVDSAEYVSQFFCFPTPTALADKISEVLQMDPTGYAPTLEQMNACSLQRQLSINSTWASQTAEKTDKQTAVAMSAATISRGEVAADRLAVISDSDLSVAVAIPVYKTALGLVSELLMSILRSKLIPTTVVLVDDGSGEEYREALDKLVHQTLGGKINWVLLSQENKGLAGARNTALNALNEPYIFFLDSDDCLLPHTLQDALIAMLLDKRRVAATGFAVYLRETDRSSSADGSDALRSGDFWKPLGTEKARALSLFENQYLTANAMVRTSCYKSVGGWDETDRSMWEDWALYSKLAWTGHMFSLIPAPGYLYRTSAASMSKTYSRYGARRRLVRNLPFATRLDANVIYSLVNGAGSERSLLQGAALSEREAELIQFLRSSLNKPRLRAWILKLYGVYSSLRRRG